MIAPNTPAVVSAPATAEEKVPCTTCGHKCHPRTSSGACAACLKAWLAQQNPYVRSYSHSSYRTNEMREAIRDTHIGDCNPWGENAVRCLEDYDEVPA